MGKRKDIKQSDRTADIAKKRSATGKRDSKRGASGDGLLAIVASAKRVITALNRAHREFKAVCKTALGHPPRAIQAGSPEYWGWMVNLRERMATQERLHATAVRHYMSLQVDATKVYLHHDLEKQFSEMNIKVDSWREEMAIHAQRMLEQIQPFYDLADHADRPGSPEYLKALEAVRNVRPSPASMHH